MIERRPRFRKRREKKPAKLSEFQQPRKRRPFTAFLVEDDQAVRSSLVAALEERKITVRDYMTAMEFYRDYREPVPGVLILDLRLPGMSGAELQEKLNEEDDFDLPIVMISGHADVPMAVRSIKNGAFDFLCKPIRIDDLVGAIERAYNYIYELDGELEEELEETEFSLNRLTDRERQVLGYVVEGLSSREIAAELGISTKTVEAHRARINDKMRADDVSHLIRMCFTYQEAQEG
jgi:two-component system response regulator FixJ